jgi:phage tail-like protein
MAIPEFVVNAYRENPYGSYMFAVIMDNRQVAGVSKVTALKRTTEVIEHRDGADPATKRKTPGQSKFDPITLERGVTYDTEFEQWASKVWNTEGAGSGTISLRDFRRDLTIQLLTEQGIVAKSYKIYNCWVSEYQALPELDANGNAVAIEMIKIENEGWERDETVVEQPELSLP